MRRLARIVLGSACVCRLRHRRFLALRADRGRPRQLWRESESPTGAVLSIGDPDSAMIQFRCVRPGTLRMDLAALYTGEGPQPRRVVVESGRVRASYRLTDGADDQARFGADLPAAAPVIDASRGRSSVRPGRAT